MSTFTGYEPKGGVPMALSPEPEDSKNRYNPGSGAIPAQTLGAPLQDQVNNPALAAAGQLVVDTPDTLGQDLSDLMNVTNSPLKNS